MLAISVCPFILGATLLVVAFVAWRLASREREQKISKTISLPNWFGWLADAPMFMDDRLVSAFYDAVLRPDETVVSETRSTERTDETAVKNSFGTEFTNLIPGLKASFGGEISATTSTKRGVAKTVAPIDNAPRKLVRLAMHYLVRDTDSPTRRIWEESNADPNRPWEPPASEAIQGPPRMLAFLDFPPGSRFVPMAAETRDGVIEIYEKLIDKSVLEGATKPEYPDRGDPDYASRIDDYWNWYTVNWSSSRALKTLEEATKGQGPIRWVNYRVRVQPNLTIHLNVVGNGSYDTGVYAYNLVRRGHSHGLRIVGTVRAGYSINVMAIYEK